MLQSSDWLEVDVAGWASAASHDLALSWTGPRGSAAPSAMPLGTWSRLPAYSFA
jgi:hypothetical protein